jgi:hypothetical protein
MMISRAIFLPNRSRCVFGLVLLLCVCCAGPVWAEGPERTNYAPPGDPGGGVYETDKSKGSGSSIYEDGDGAPKMRGAVGFSEIWNRDHDTPNSFENGADQSPWLMISQTGLWILNSMVFR